MRIASNNNVGIGTTAPASRLHINGEAQVGTSGAACTATNGGAIRYTGGSLFYCNGTNNTWSTVGSGGAAAAAGVSGSIQFNSGGALAGRSDLLVDASGAIRLGTGTAATAAIELGDNPSGNRYAFVDLTGDTTYTDYGLRMIRENTGANANSSILHRGTGVLSLWTQDNAPIRFLTSSTEAMRILPNNNVGINTTTPAYTLDVSGSFATRGPGNGIYVTDRSNSSFSTFYRQNNFTRFYDSDSASDRLMINNTNGSVGIGITPEAPLHVSGSILLNNSTYLRTKDDQGNLRNLLGAASDGSVYASGYRGTNMLLGVNGLTYLYGSGGASTPAMAITQGGRVGIGHTIASSTLHVNGEVQPGSSGAACAAANNGAIRYVGGALQYCVGTTWTEFASSTGATAAAAGVSGSIQFRDGTGALAGRNTILVDGAGNIITNGTGSAFFAGSNGTGNGYSWLSQGTSANAGYTSFNVANGTRTGYIGWGDATTGPEFTSTVNAPLRFNVNTSTEAMRILPNGSVGIGTTAPYGMLQVHNPAGLATTAGAVNNFLRLTESNGNNNLFDIYERRHTAGSNWLGTSMRMQRSIDATPMGFIDFGVDGGASGYGLGFGSGTTTRMVINDVGNVGIGTTTPGFKLHVVNSGISDIRSEGTSYAKTSYKVSGAGTNQKAWQFTADATTNTFGLSSLNDAESSGLSALLIQRGAADAITSVNFPNGLVGIGTTTPNQRLSVVGNVSATGLVTNLGTGSGGLVNMSMYDNNVLTWGLGMSGLRGTGNTGAAFNIWRYANDGSYLSNPLAIQRNTGNVIFNQDGSGNVGIGTGTPLAKLDTNGTVRSTGYTPPSSGTGLELSYITDAGLAPIGGYLFAYDRAASAAKNLYMGGAGNAVSILANGNVGIGTANPSNKLEVAGTIQAATGGNSIVGYTNGNGSAVYGIGQSTNSNAVYGANTATGAAGALAPGNGYGVYCAAGACGGVNAWTNTSDARLKERVQTVPDTRGLAMVERLRPVTFHWKDQARDAKQGQRLGFIAQEVEKLYPELVTTDPSSTMKSLSYAELVVPLTKAVQELKADNDNLRAQLDELRAEVRAMKR